MKIDYKHKGLDTIQDIRSHLFQTSKQDQKRSLILGVSSLGFAVFPLVFSWLFESEEMLQLIFSLLTAIFAILQWGFRYKAIKSNTEAREVGNYELIYNLSNRRRIGELIYKRLPDVINGKKVYSLYDEKKEYYSSLKEINVYQETSYRILENCVWNRYLFLQMYRCKKKLIGIIVVVFLLFLSTILYCPNFFSLIFCIMSIILASSLAFNYMESLYSAKSAIALIDPLIKELMSTRIDTREKFQGVYSAYSHLNLKSPNIPDNMYVKHREKLNRVWMELRNKLPESDVISSINTVLPIIKNLLDSNGVQWAVMGSASEVIRGKRRYCRDIDIIIADRKDIEKVNTLFSPFIIEEVMYYPSESIRSYYGKLNVGGVNIDIVCDIENLIHNNHWEPHPNIEIEKVCFHGVKYPISSLAFEKKVKIILSMKK